MKSKTSPVTIAVLGPQGTFSEEAARLSFGGISDLELQFFGTIDDVFSQVEQNKVYFAVVPVENSTEGSVNRTLDRFVEQLEQSSERFSLQVMGEVMLRVSHHLLSCAQNAEEIQQVFAHQQSLAQCRRWLTQNLPSAQLISVSSNGEGARLAVSTRDSAAIASRRTAEIYRLPIRFSQIEDEPDNTTRFWVLGNEQVGPSGRDKTSLLLTVSNRPGILYQALEPFARYGIDLIKIESRPSRRSRWDYVFFIDIDGHAERPDVVSALQELQTRISRLRVLGSYPRSE